MNKLFINPLFKDAKNNVIFYDKYKDTAYRIPKQSVSMFKAFQNRGLYCVIIFLLMYDNNYPVIISSIAGIGLYLLATTYFYKGLLPKYNILSKFNLETALENQVTNTVLEIFVAILYAVSVAIIIYLSFTDFDKVFAIVGGLYSIFAIFKIAQTISLLKK